MFERFTDRARRVVVLAQDEARGLKHNYIGTEHLLLGLISEGEGVAAKALETMEIKGEAVAGTRPGHELSAGISGSLTQKSHVISLGQFSTGLTNLGIATTTIQNLKG